MPIDEEASIDKNTRGRWQPDAAGWINTGTHGYFMGWINVTHDPWVYSVSLDDYIYLAGENLLDGGAWMYVPR